jgi:hypothetical protein
MHTYPEIPNVNVPDDADIAALLGIEDLRVVRHYLRDEDRTRVGVVWLDTSGCFACCHHLITMAFWELPPFAGKNTVAKHHLDGSRRFWPRTIQLLFWKSITIH